MRRLEKLGALGAAATLVVGGAFVGAEMSKNPSVAGAPRGNEITTPRVNEAGASPTPVDLGGTPTPEASTAPEVQVQAFHIDPLGTLEVQPGDLVIGDVAISDTAESTPKPLYDTDTHKAADVTNNAATALYVEVQAPGVVHAQWGADVMRNMNDQQKTEFLKLQKIEKEASGFSVMDIVTWTGADTTVDQAGLTSHFNGELPTNPTETQTPGESQAPSDYSDALYHELIALDTETLTLDQKLELAQLMVWHEMMECTCASGTCPVHSPEPSATPTPIATPEVCLPMDDHVMEPGEVYTTQEGNKYIVQGDVLVDGVKYFDNNEDTYAVLKLSGKHKIKANWGADVQIFCPADATYEEIYNKDLQEGAANGRTLDNHSKTVN